MTDSLPANDKVPRFKVDVNTDPTRYSYTAWVTDYQLGKKKLAQSNTLFGYRRDIVKVKRYFRETAATDTKRFTDE